MGSCRVDRVSGGGVKNIKKKLRERRKNSLLFWGFSRSNFVATF